MRIVIVMMNYEMRIGLPRRRPSRHQKQHMPCPTQIPLNSVRSLRGRIQNKEDSPV